MPFCFAFSTLCCVFPFICIWVEYLLLTEKTRYCHLVGYSCTDLAKLSPNTVFPTHLFVEQTLKNTRFKNGTGDFS